MSARKSYLEDKNRMDCCSCGACAQVCPASCITMKYQDGFFYPHILTDQCIGCKRCINVCQYHRKYRKTHSKQEIYAAWNREEEVLVQSTSGGIFSAVAEAVLKAGGIVFGSIYDENWNAGIKKK